MLTSSGQAANLYGRAEHLPRAGSTWSAPAPSTAAPSTCFYKTMKEMGIDDHLRAARPPPLEELRGRLASQHQAPSSARRMANPSLASAGYRSVFAQAAHAQGVPLIVDNTFPTPINCRPFEFGADIVTHSTTKYMDGHAVAGGRRHCGFSGNFDWDGPRGQVPRAHHPRTSPITAWCTPEQFGKAAPTSPRPAPT